MFWAIYLAVFFAGTAMMVREGLWSNAISLVNILDQRPGGVRILFAAGDLPGRNARRPVHVLAGLRHASGRLFVVTMIICRAVTGMASKTRMRFKNPIDPVGGPLVGVIAAWVLAAFVMATLAHLADAERRLRRETDPQQERSRLAIGLLAPDLGWLRFVDRVTRPDAFGHASRRCFLGHGVSWRFTPTIGRSLSKANAALDSSASWLSERSCRQTLIRKLDVETSSNTTFATPSAGVVGADEEAGYRTLSVLSLVSLVLGFVCAVVLRGAAIVCDSHRRCGGVDCWRFVGLPRATGR